MTAEPRRFEISPGVRRAAGLLVGLVGPSGSGKTVSALRLATGIQRVVGGSIVLVDTENSRALYYADDFKFQHMPFAAPFSPTDYLEAIRCAAHSGSKTIIVDSMSHEHEGPGGVLEWHAAEIQRMAGDDLVKAEKVNMLAWGAPKQARRRMINELLQLNVNILLTFRAKEKLKPQGGGKPPLELGWQPITGDEIMYEMIFQAILRPGCRGEPSWKPERPAEKEVIKLPRQFEALFREARQFDEDHGEAMARWAAGGAQDTKLLDELLAAYAACMSKEDFDACEARRTAAWDKPEFRRADGRRRMQEASAAAKARLQL